MNHKPSGVFIYTPDGRLSTHIMKTPPLTPQEGRRTPRDSPHARDFLAYQGTYPVGPDAGILTRQVVGALKPAYVATRRQRPSRIDGDELKAGICGEQAGQSTWVAITGINSNIQWVSLPGQGSGQRF